MNNSDQKTQAFIQFLERHKKLIAKIASSYFSDATHRSDLMQEIALQLWKGFLKLKTPPQSSTWVYKVALNVSISYYRKEANRKKTLSNYKEHLQIFGLVAEQLPDKLQALYQLIAHLNPIEKAIIILHLEGCKNAEIAEVMGFSLTNVSTKINRIKEKLIKHSRTDSREN